jgi:hypothetical protein
VRDVVLVDGGEQEEGERGEHIGERGHVPQRAAVDPARCRARAQLGECLQRMRSARTWLKTYDNRPPP